MNEIIIDKRNIESINVGIGTCLCHIILVKTTIIFFPMFPLEPTDKACMI